MTKPKSPKHDAKAKTPSASDALEPAVVRKKNLQALAKKSFTVAAALPLWDQTTLRPVEEIAARLTALRLLLLWVTTTSEMVADEDVRAAVRTGALARWLTPKEKKILALSRAQALALHQDTIGWRLENMLPLAWVLGHEEPLNWQGAMITETEIDRLLGFIRWRDGASALAQRARPRPAAEVWPLADLFYAAHNAVRSAQLGGATVPEGFDPVENGGVIHERRHALEWALSPGVAWEDMDLST